MTLSELLRTVFWVGLVLAPLLCTYAAGQYDREASVKGNNAGGFAYGVIMLIGTALQLALAIGSYIAGVRS